MFVKTYGGALRGIDAIPITVEVSVTRGSLFTIVGLPDTAIKESVERIRSAVSHSGIEFPRHNIVVNLAPADVRKEGSAFDLPIAVAILAAGERVNAPDADRFFIMGELSLDGTLLPIRGALPIALAARAGGFDGIILPAANANEAAVVDGLKVYGMNNLTEVLNFMADHSLVKPTVIDIDAEFARAAEFPDLDFADVKGQTEVRRALEIASAGGHNLMTVRPFRSPHHTVSPVAMVGGGSSPMPGEISLAHNGVLFLDEFPEFSRQVLEVLRQPLEDRTITVSRAKYTVDYPAGFMLVASMNPCPCGYYTHPTRPCICQPGQVARYKNRISGPLFDRIDLQVLIQPVPIEELTTDACGESSADIRARVVRARAIQTARFANEPGIHTNAQMTSRLLRRYCPLSEQTKTTLTAAINKFNMSARAYDRILRVARTIADLDQSADIERRHIAEAIFYRSLDRASWGTALPTKPAVGPQR